MTRRNEPLHVSCYVADAMRTIFGQLTTEPRSEPKPVVLVAKKNVHLVAGTDPVKTLLEAFKS